NDVLKMIVQERRQRGPITHDSLVAPHDAIIGWRIALYSTGGDPVEDLVWGRREGDAFRGEAVPALQHDPAPISLAERRWLLVVGAVQEKAFEAGLVDLVMGVSWILHAYDL